MPETPKESSTLKTSSPPRSASALRSDSSSPQQVKASVSNKSSSTTKLEADRVASKQTSVSKTAEPEIPKSVGSVSKDKGPTSRSKAQSDSLKTAKKEEQAQPQAETSTDDYDDEDSPYAVKEMTQRLNEIEAATEAAQGPRAPRQYKIAMFAWESLHSIAVGGVAPHLTELAAGMERRGHEVHVYVRSGEGQAAYEQIHGVHIHRVKFELSPDFVQEVQNMCNAMVHFMVETEAYMDSKFDICHCHDWLAAPALINIKHNMGRTCTFTLHSTEYGRCGNNTYGGQSARIRSLEQEALSLADRVIAVSGVLCDEIKERYSFDWDKLRCVHNGINCLRYDGNLWDPAEVREKYGVGPLDPMVLFVGRMASQKGPDILIEAVPAILGTRPDAKVVMVGDGYMKQGLVNRVHEMGVTSSVCFTGQMGGQDLVDLFKTTDIVAIPSRNEPFGIVVLEAWASCKPVVVTKSGGPREFVWHDNDGFLVDTSVDGMAWGVSNCFKSFDHAKYMGDRGRVKAAFQFSWDKIAELTNNAYDELFGIYPPPPQEKPEYDPNAIARRMGESESSDRLPVAKDSTAQVSTVQAEA